MGSMRKRLSSSSRQCHKIPNSVQCGDPGLSRKYFTRKHSSKIRTNDLPMEPNHLGFHSPWAFLWYFFFLIAPLAYIYIALMLLRDLCEYFPETIQQPLDQYLPFLARLTKIMKSYYGCYIVDLWCIIEAVFFIYCKFKIRYLQSKDPLEACLSAAPMLDSEERKSLWDHIMAVESEPSWLEEWFLEKPSIESISLYDVYDFICWALFDGRNQEHLTSDELNDLEGFVEDLEYRISLQLYGAMKEEDSGGTILMAENNERRSNDLVEDELTRTRSEIMNRTRTLSDTATISDREDVNSYKYDLNSIDETQTIYDSPLKFRTRNFTEGETTTGFGSGSSSNLQSVPRPRPNKLFRFRRDIEREGPNYFSDLYESYKIRYDKYKNMIENTDFNPVQDFRNLVAETAQQAAKTAHSAEESAIKSAQTMYETIIQPGSQMEKHFSAFSHATSIQISEAWNSVKGMKERLETAKFLSEKRSALMQQVRGNRAMLTRMREMSYAVNSKQMAALMRKLTESYEALENIEIAARDGFLNAAGKLTDNSLFKIQEPKRYARYSSDPILGIAASPLCITLILLGATEVSLRILLKRRGFQRRSIGPIAYYYHPGSKSKPLSIYTENMEYYETSPKTTPVVFIHGIGVGLICYLPLIDSLIESGRPLFLPELPYVSAFRPWQSSRNVLSPAVVASTMTAMLAFHGFSKGCFIGHSYGTSWLSYVCKYAHSTVAALLFLDPICFCLYHPHLTKSFVYHRPDPGSIAFIVRTDMMVNWTIQRAFPWTWIVLFLDQVSVPCTIFVADEDALVPAEKVLAYLQSKGVPLADADTVDIRFFEGKGDIKSCVWRGACHGAFTEQKKMVPNIAIACNALCGKVELRELIQS